MELLDVVALIEDVPEHGLRRGQVGTIVEVWEDGVFEVEFADTDGVAYAFAALRAEQLLVLQWQPDASPSA
jgi:hypothetical protein